VLLRTEICECFTQQFIIFVVILLIIPFDGLAAKVVKFTLILDNLLIFELNCMHLSVSFFEFRTRFLFGLAEVI
jgi:hypothetical protein